MTDYWSKRQTNKCMKLKTHCLSLWFSSNNVQIYSCRYWLLKVAPPLLRSNTFSQFFIVFLQKHWWHASDSLCRLFMSVWYLLLSLGFPLKYHCFYLVPSTWRSLSAWARQKPTTHLVRTALHEVLRFLPLCASLDCLLLLARSLTLSTKYKTLKRSLRVRKNNQSKHQWRIQGEFGGSCFPQKSVVSFDINAHLCGAYPVEASTQIKRHSLNQWFIIY